MDVAHSTKIFIGSIFGMFGVVLFPYIQFLHELQTITFESFILLAGVCILTPVILSAVYLKKISPDFAFLGPVLFIGLSLVSLMWGSQIKDYMSLKAGFFDSEAGELAEPPLLNNAAPHFFRDAGVAFSLNSAWISKQHPVLGYEYFVLENDNERQAEIRPTCAHGSNKGLAEWVLALGVSGSQDSKPKQCFLWRDDFRACWIEDAQDDTWPFRYRFISENRAIPQSFQFDLVTNKYDPSALSDFRELLRSINITPIAPNPNCVIISAWL
ncbi:hypothetical protein OLMES_3923 [Oleiphilus messinensis]|uniref:Uncharacterized protein n=1 Tax=Oleiphilus messinensis TaxID=141451 RepID=A0A1Y0IEZ3_9GAMM|nr:hypothetical protein [Oleiphilus messinensis]ARU57943.1 hypothetical protein OLMES_3923 [Oleiphilus messinensis]